jgi:CDP-diacylglycerol--glycerol-3-phosphate 3-phosphatidyltransferase
VNLPNKLTLSRFAFTAGFLVVIFSHLPYRQTVGLALFVAAGISDFLDGLIARRRNLITNFGILMDPLADKIMICSAFIAFVELGWFAAWMAVIVVARELAITGLRLLAASKNVVLAAERNGKHKTISQIVAVIAIFIDHIMQDNEWGSIGQAIFGWHIFGPHSWSWWVAEIFKWLSVALTFFSGAVYLWKNRRLYLDDM